MKYLYAGLLALVFVSLCSSIIFAEDDLLVDTSPGIVDNQEMEETVAPIESIAPFVADEVATPLDLEENSLLLDDESEKDDRVMVEPVEPSESSEPFESGEPVFETVGTFTERSPFSRIKQLAGRWEGFGENTPGEKSNKIVVVYDITAGGNAVMERIFPGTSQEMVTMYYEQKGQLTLTHYCLIGTRSTMMLKPLVGLESSRPNNNYEFSLIENIDLDPTVDTHMHSLKVAFIDENHMNQSWEMFEAGKPSGTYSFVLARVVDKPKL